MGKKASKQTNRMKVFLCVYVNLYRTYCMNCKRSIYFYQHLSTTIDVEFPIARPFCSLLCTFHTGIPHRKKAFTKRFPTYDEIICTFIYVQVHMKTLKWFSRKRKKPNCICGFGERRNLSHRWEGWMNHSTQHMSHKVGAVCLFCLVTFIRWREKVSSFFLIATN